MYRSKVRATSSARLVARAGGFVAAATSAAVLSVATTSSGASKAECAESHVAVQRLRSAGRFAAARPHLATCADPSCPPLILEECRAFAVGIDAAQPSLAFDVRDTSGARAADVAVRIDAGEVRPLGVVPLPVDPGAHDVEVLLATGASRTIRVVVREGEQQLVAASFMPETSASVPPRRPRDGGARPVLPPLLFGVGATTFVMGAVFGTLALSQGASLEDGCGRTRTCDPTEVEQMNRRALVADVSFIVAALSTAAALVLSLGTQPRAAVAGGAR